MAMQGCLADVKQEQLPELAQAKPVVSLQLLGDGLTTKKRKQWNAAKKELISSSNVENSQPLLPNQIPAWDTEIEENVVLNQNELSRANSPESAKQGNYMTLTPLGKTNTLGNPLYQLSLYGNGQLLRVYTTVSGRVYTQNRNRHKSGTEAPLPDGLYNVARSTIPGTEPEVGERFLPIQPLFQTGRSALGIHYDPSFEQGNGKDGTSGCIGLTNKLELNDLLNSLRIYQPEYLEVNIQ
jgi:hypothetical protein